MKYYLAVDIGASSGRLILSHLEEGKMILEEIHRFENGMKPSGTHLVWDTNHLFEEILTGMKKCKELGKIPVSMGIDTWAVDFVLLDARDQMIGEAVGYRDQRTQGIEEKVYQIISEEELYAVTGIQRQSFNTIYQLMAVKEQAKEMLQQATTLLMIPDYLNFLLTGKKVTEYTNATTTQLLNPVTKDWNEELIEKLGLPQNIFQKICPPGEVLGGLKEEIKELVGFDTQVILPATHDTGSAVMAVPSGNEDVLYISSGTWSLMGTELLEANCSKESQNFNFTNEGGYEYRFRYLKNIMGMWMINSARKELAPTTSFHEICRLAAEETISSTVDANDNRFLAPESMVEEVRAACKETNQQVPNTMSEVAAVIYHSLALCYEKTVEEIQHITGKTFACIHVIGGGANATYLNELTAKYCKKKVLAGPIEATAIGNVMAQMIADDVFKDLAQGRECVYRSFEIKEF